jgi:citrate/tricarballylate utilization protein
LQQLTELVALARADADGIGSASAHVIPIRPALPLTASEAEVARILQICNACRYCEGFCAVFPAMTRRLEFGKADTHYLANLCHNCGSCLHACQYAPPHEFAVNVPQAMAQVRMQTYHDYAWPPAMGALYKKAGLTVALALAGGLALFLVLAVAMTGTLLHEPLAGNFYAIFPHNFLAPVFGVVFGFVLFALAMGVRRFWREV